MTIVVPEFPEVVDDCIKEAVNDLWNKYPSVEQCLHFVDRIVVQIAEQFKEDLREIAKDVLPTQIIHQRLRVCLTAKWFEGK